jgi:hypothetical protein
VSAARHSCHSAQSTRGAAGSTWSKSGCLFGRRLHLPPSPRVDPPQLATADRSRGWRSARAGPTHREGLRCGRRSRGRYPRHPHRGWTSASTMNRWRRQVPVASPRDPAPPNLPSACSSHRRRCRFPPPVRPGLRHKPCTLPYPDPRQVPWPRPRHHSLSIRFPPVREAYLRSRGSTISKQLEPL